MSNRITLSNLTTFGNRITLGNQITLSSLITLSILQWFKLWSIEFEFNVEYTKNNPVVFLYLYLFNLREQFSTNHSICRKEIDLILPVGIIGNIIICQIVWFSLIPLSHSTHSFWIMVLTGIAYWWKDRIISMCDRVRLLLDVFHFLPCLYHQYATEHRLYAVWDWSKAPQI